MRKFRGILICGLMAALMILSQGVQGGKNPARHEILKSQFTRFPLGDYDLEPRNPEGRVDIAKLIELIKQAHINTYDFLIWHDKNDWDDLGKFLSLAQSSGIKVWVTIVPPSEPPPSEPFKDDYIAWAEKIAELSLKHTNLTAFVIDDFERAENLRTFTPEYIKKMVRGYRAINPKLAFFPCVYPSTIRGGGKDFMKDYGQCIDGILYAFVDLDSAANLAKELKACRDMLGKGKLLMLNIYAAPTSWHEKPPTPDYLLEAIKISREAADGIRLYCLPKAETDALYKTVQRIFGEMSR